MGVPTLADITRAKANLDAYDDVVNGGTSDVITTPGGALVDSVAKAIETLKGFNFRGNWAQSTVYALKDVVSDPDDPGGPVYVRVIAGSSPGSGTFQDEFDSGAGPWRIFQGLSLNAVIYASVFGIVADGTFTANGTDNANAIKALIQHCAANPGLTVIWPQDRTKTINFTGYLQFSHCKSVRHFFGSPLRNSGSWNAGGATLTFGGGSLFTNHLVGINTEISRQFPYPISTVAAGSDTVVLVSSGDASNFYPGQWVAVMGYDQQGGGFPPNYRYVDYRRVKSISGGTIVLDKPLDHGYYSSWYFYVSSGSNIGPAGIQPLDRDANMQFCETLEVHDLNFLPNLTDTTPSGTVDGENYYASGILGVFGCKQAQLFNCKSSQFWTGESESVTINDQEIVEFEPDKNQRHLIINRGRITRINQATGVENLIADGTVFKFQTAVVARNYAARKCRYLNNQAPTGINGPIGTNISLYQQSQVYEDCQFDWDQNTSILIGQSPTEAAGATDKPGILSLTVSNDIAPSASQITANYNSGSSGGDGRIRLELGQGTVLTRPSDMARWVVQEIEYVGSGGTDASGYFKISLSGAATPVNGNVLYYYPIRAINVQNPILLGRRKIPFLGGSGKRYSDVYRCPTDGYFGRNLDIVLRDVPPAPSGNNFYDIDGILEEIEVVVTAAYGGAGDNRVTIEAGTPYGSTFPGQTINTATIGQRFIYPDAIVDNNGGSPPSGESLTAFGYNRYIGLINVRPLASDNPGASGWDGYVRIKATRR